MTDKYESKARLLLNQLFDGFPEMALPKLAAALRSARAEAFEEIAEAFKNMPAVAAAIRAAKDKP